MKRTHLILIGVLAAAGLALGVGAVATQKMMDDDVEVSIDAVPAAVRATILAQAGGNAVDEIEMETENGRTVYEAEVVIDGRKVEIEVAEDGTLLGQDADDDEDAADDDEDADDDDEEEVTVSLAELPEAVRATLAKEAGAAAISEIERETENGQTLYSAEVIIDGQEVEFEIAPDGTLLGREVEDDDE